MIGTESLPNETSIFELTIDQEFKNLISPLSQEEYNGLELSILNEGCRDALVVWDGIIVDGHNRYEICKRHNLFFNVEKKVFESRDEAILWILYNQLSRRNISIDTRIELAEKIRARLTKSAKEKQACGQGGSLLCSQVNKAKVDVNAEIAKIAGCGKTTVAKRKKVREKASPELKEKLRTGEISPNEAYKEIRIAEKEQQKQVAIENIKALTTPTGKYHVIVVDPPWEYEKRNSDKTHRGRCTYPTMSVDAICDMEIPAEEDAVLWLWTTNAFLHEAYHIIDAWEFTPKTVLTWVKDRMGTGDWLRGKTEHCILAVKGKPVIDLTNQTTVLNAPLREHSRKPDEFYKLVSDLCLGRKIDMFSREPREGWDQWGGEVDKF